MCQLLNWHCTLTVIRLVQQKKKKNSGIFFHRSDKFIFDAFVTLFDMFVGKCVNALWEPRARSPNFTEHACFMSTHTSNGERYMPKKVNKKMISKLIDDIFNITFSWVRLRLSHWQTLWCAFFALSSKKLMYFWDRKHETCSTAYKLCCKIRNIQQVRFCHGVNLRDDELFLVYYL